METAIITSGGSPREPQNSFIVFLIVIVIALLIAGCKGSQHLAVTERITHDTCYISNVQYDSIYIDNLHFIDRASDTIVIRDRKTEFRYKFLRDTIKVVQCDSIPYEVRVIETKTERYTPWYARTLAFIGILTLVWFAIRIFIKIKFIH